MARPPPCPTSQRSSPVLVPWRVLIKIVNFSRRAETAMLSSDDLQMVLYSMASIQYLIEKYFERNDTFVECSMNRVLLKINSVLSFIRLLQDNLRNLVISIPITCVYCGLYSLAEYAVRPADRTNYQHKIFDTLSGVVSQQSRLNVGSEVRYPILKQIHQCLIAFCGRREVLIKASLFINTAFNRCRTIGRCGDIRYNKVELIIHALNGVGCPFQRSSCFKPAVHYGYETNGPLLICGGNLALGSLPCKQSGAECCKNAKQCLIAVEPEFEAIRPRQTFEYFRRFDKLKLLISEEIIRDRTRNPGQKKPSYKTYKSQKAQERNHPPDFMRFNSHAYPRGGSWRSGCEVRKPSTCSIHIAVTAEVKHNGMPRGADA